jgi:hypothetical protein
VLLILLNRSERSHAGILIVRYRSKGMIILLMTLTNHLDGVSVSAHRWLQVCRLEMVIPAMSVFMNHDAFDGVTLNSFIACGLGTSLILSPVVLFN